MMGMKQKLYSVVTSGIKHVFIALRQSAVKLECHLVKQLFAHNFFFHLAKYGEQEG